MALQSFGGPAGQIAVMHRIIVEEKKWIDENRFLHALNYCMLLPGPEAQQLTIYIGWLLHKYKGGLIAGILFVLPGFIAILILSILYSLYNDVSFVQAIFYGIKPAVLAIVIQAVFKIGKKVLKNKILFIISALAFIGIFFFNIPFPLLIIGAGVTGFIGGKFFPESFLVIGIEDSKAIVRSKLPAISKTIKVALTFLFLWLAPLILIFYFLGSENIFFKEGIFFSKVAVVTFGGAYAILAYIAQQAVENYGWLQPGEMLDGLGMAETTPGPLIMVLQFVGYMGAFRAADVLDPLTAGIVASVLATWVTFIPCFLWVFTGAPYFEYFRGNKIISSSLTAITSAVVGVIANLSIWFFIHTIFSRVSEVMFLNFISISLPDISSIDLISLFISIIAMILLLRFKLNLFLVMGICVMLGLIGFYLF